MGKSEKQIRSFVEEEAIVQHIDIEAFFRNAAATYAPNLPESDISRKWMRYSKGAGGAPHFLRTHLIKCINARKNASLSRAPGRTDATAFIAT